MKKRFKLVFFLLLLVSSRSSAQQEPSFYLDNSLKFVIDNDTVPYPFTGGYIAPLFSEIDLNGDNIKDLFVWDKMSHKGQTWINLNQPGKIAYAYAPQYESAFPEFNYWVLLRDYNCDGKMDIFADNRIGGIALYKNVSDADGLKFEMETNELYDYFYMSNVSIPLTDLPAIDDVDGDGDLDIISFTPLGTYAQMYRNSRNERALSCDSNYFELIDLCWGTFVEGATSNEITLGVGCYPGMKSYKNMLHAGGTLTTLDIDGDGDKDALIGDSEFNNLTLIKNGKKEFAWPYDTIVSQVTNYPEANPIDISYFPAAYHLDVDNDGKKDLIAAPFETFGVSNTEQIWLYKDKGNNGKVDFEFVKKKFLQDQTIDFGSSTAPKFADVDGDGDLDLLVVNRGSFAERLNAYDQIALFTNVGTTEKPIFSLTDMDWLKLSNRRIFAARICFEDLDNDSLPDMLIGKQNGKIDLYKNIGTNKAPNWNITSTDYFNIDAGTFASPLIYDVNKDGLNDILIGEYQGYIRYFQNTGEKGKPNFDSVATLDSFGHIRVESYELKFEPIFENNVLVRYDTSKDYTGAGFAEPYIANLSAPASEEIVVGSQSGRVYVYKIYPNNPDSPFEITEKFFQYPNATSKTTVNAGLRSAPACADLNNDGVADIIIGNIRGGLTYMSSKETVIDTIEVNSSLYLKEMQGVSVFPNPSNGLFQVKIPAEITEYSLRVYDLLGRELQHFTLKQNNGDLRSLNLKQETDGVFVVRIEANGYKPFTKKLIKQGY